MNELIGDILLVCHNVAPASGFEPRGHFEADLSVSLNAASSNRVDHGFGPTVTDAVLAINGKQCDSVGPDRRFTNCSLGNSTVQDPMLARLDPLDFQQAPMERDCHSDPRGGDRRRAVRGGTSGGL